MEQHKGDVKRRWWGRRGVEAKVERGLMRGEAQIFRRTVNLRSMGAAGSAAAKRSRPAIC